MKNALIYVMKQRNVFTHKNFLIQCKDICFSRENSNLSLQNEDNNSKTEQASTILEQKSGNEEHQIKDTITEVATRFKQKKTLHSKGDIIMFLTQFKNIITKYRSFIKLEDIFIIFSEMERLHIYLRHEKIKEWSGPFWNRISMRLEGFVDNINLKDLSKILSYYSELAPITAKTIEFLRKLLNLIKKRLNEREYINLQKEELEYLIEIYKSLSLLDFEKAIENCQKIIIIEKKKHVRRRYKGRKNPAYYYVGKRNISLKKIHKIDQELAEGGTAGLGEMFNLGPMGGIPVNAIEDLTKETDYYRENELFVKNKHFLKESMEAFEEEKMKIAKIIINRALPFIDIWEISHMMKILKALPKLKYIDRNMNIGSKLLTKLIEIKEDNISNKNVCKIVKNLGLIYSKVGESDLLHQFLNKYFIKDIINLDVNDISNIITGLSKLKAKNIQNFLDIIISKSEENITDFEPLELSILINGLGKLDESKDSYEEFLKLTTEEVDKKLFRFYPDEISNLLAGYSYLHYHPNKKTLNKICAKIKSILLDERNYESPEYNFNGTNIAILAYSLAQIHANVPNVFELIRDEIARGNIIKTDPFEMSLCLWAFVISNQIDLESFNSILTKIEELTPDNGHGDGYDIIRHRVAKTLIHFHVNDEIINVEEGSFLEQCFMNYALYSSNSDRISPIISEAIHLLETLSIKYELRQAVAKGLIYVDFIHTLDDQRYVLEVSENRSKRGNLPNGENGEKTWYKNILKKLNLKVIYIDEEVWHGISNTEKLDYLKTLIGLNI